MLRHGLKRASTRWKHSLQHSTPRALSQNAEPQPNYPSIAPRPSIDIKSIRSNPEYYVENCIARNCKDQLSNPYRINELSSKRYDVHRTADEWRKRNNAIEAQLAAPQRVKDTGGVDNEDVTEGTEKLLIEARQLKERLRESEEQEKELGEEIESLAIELPNLTSRYAPRGNEPRVVSYINERPAYLEGSQLEDRDHVKIGAKFDLLDFAGAANVSGWGWYFLKNEAALLEQALVQYALSVAMNHGFSVSTPPSMVYSHIGAACGFRPRDQSGEQQVYMVEQTQRDREKDKPNHSLTGTAEIPFAGIKANETFDHGDLPLHIVGPSRCYRAEAGARGRGTRGLYRVHEFTKVEMFAWTLPHQEELAFNDMLKVQKEILTALGLYCRILEMPTTELGASAYRKQDIEAFFPSRIDLDEGWGEVTSTSICKDYQTRRLNTHVKMPKMSKEKISFPGTVNGTAIAIPRVLAALLENGYEGHEQPCIKIPEVLWPWMHAIQAIKQ